MPTQTPRLVTLLETAVKAGVGEVWTALPGRITKVDQNFVTVDVQPLVRRGYQDESGERVAESLPIVPDCPVVFMGGKSSGRLTFPLFVGDDGLLIMTSCALDQYLVTGNEVDPGDDRRNSLSDAFFIPGINHWAGPGSFGGPPDEYSTTDVVLSATNILKLGSKDASESAVQGTSFANALNNLVDKLKTVIDAVPGLVSGSGVPAWTAALTAFDIAAAAFDVGDHLSAKVVVE